MALSPDNAFFLVCDRRGIGGDVIRVDTNTNTATRTYKGFRGPMGLDISPDTSFALVADWGDEWKGGIGHIDLRTHQVSFPYPDGGISEPCGVAISPDASFALFTNGDEDDEDSDEDSDDDEPSSRRRNSKKRGAARVGP